MARREQICRTDFPGPPCHTGVGAAFRLICATLLAVSSGLTATVATAPTSRAAGPLVPDDSGIATASAGLDPFQQRLLRTLADDMNGRVTQRELTADDPTVGPGAVFAPGTPDSVVTAFYSRFPNHGRYRGSSRWSSTATQSGLLLQGDPTTVTWGFAQDGSAIQGSGIGEPNNTSNARAFSSASTDHRPPRTPCSSRSSAIDTRSG